MLTRDLRDCPEIIAGDRSVLRELLHPAKAALKLRYSLAHATVLPGRKSAPHRLRTSEVYYILSGKGIMHVNDERARVAPGQAIYIPPNARQFITAIGRTPLRFLCIVDPAWRRQDERVEPTKLKARSSKLKPSSKPW
jgi:mannose-6-phosphate isomerase-like protein (cupin superfamily)